ncbi:MAG: hypothetical protein IJ222_06345 [Bacteroidales bacterium]|nr:hypothetical protein [Bacteroidales bacterium]
MKKSAILFFLVLICSCNRSGFDMKEFRNPGASYRSQSFWSLNDSLSADELKRQLSLFKEGGFGGAFLHSRTGLLTPYLSEEWFDLMDTCVEEAQRLGLETWFYDEDKWPSGWAGGIVPAQDEAFRARTLVRLPKGYEVESPDRVIHEDEEHLYVEHVERLGDAWYNGTCWVDLMNPDMVNAFLDCTYEPYAGRFAGRKGVMGIFSDEPQVSPRTTYGAADAFVSYSPCMEEVFRQKWGYEMDAHLPSLIDTVGDWRRFRLHYYRTVASCMEDAFSARIGDYCDRHGLVWTGHFNGEEHPTSTMRNEGNLMIQQRHLQRPGVDALGLRFKELHNAKVMTSVANQYGKRRRIVEIFGISGHNMSFEDRMWITAWHTNNGINMFCPHLSLYSMKGCRKRDYPPTFSYQEPFFEKNRLFEDYSARLAYFATVGSSDGEVCVISPLESDYITTDIAHYDNSPSESDALQESILRSLASHQLNSDLGDEQIISEIASVRDGRFVIGEMSYHTVILPGLVNIRPSTLALLLEFAAQGGTILCVGKYPEYLEGERDAMTELRRFSRQVAPDALDRELDMLPHAFRLESDGRTEIWTHLRTVPGGKTLQLSNTSRTESYNARIRFENNPGNLVVLNPLDGRALRIRPSADGSYELNFAPAQTWILACGKAFRKTDGTYSLPPSGSAQVCELGGEWTLKRNSPNAIPLDFASWSTDGGASWNEAEPVLAIYQRYGRNNLPGGPMLLRFNFDVKDLPRTCALAVEQPWIYKDVRVNGTPVHFGRDFFVDSYFRKCDISSLLHTGGNEIVLSLDFVTPVSDSFTADRRYGTEIETIYLCGDFAVRGELSASQPVETWRGRNPILSPKPMPACFTHGSFVLCAESGHATAGNLTLGDYPFFAGSISYCSSFNIDSLEKGASYKLSFPDVEATYVDVIVNGKALPTVFCSPWEADVSDALMEGENSVEITLTNGLRNLMGPYHHVGGEFSAVGPALFDGRDEWPNYEKGDDDWYEVRKGGNARLWRDDYYCIAFGLMKAPIVKKEF